MGASLCVPLLHAYTPTCSTTLEIPLAGHNLHAPSASVVCMHRMCDYMQA